MIIVTGGAGFIGSNIVAALEARGETEVVVCDSLGEGDKWRNIAKRDLMGILPPESLFDFLERQRGAIDAVFHMGAISSTTVTDADLVVANNVNFSLKLWEWCVLAEARFIYASSAATYGDGAGGFDDDESVDALRQIRPLNLYGWSKHLFDRRIARLNAEGQPTPPQWAGLKFFNVFGPNEYHKGPMRSVAHQLHEQISAGDSVRLFRSHHPDYPDGGQMRDFVSVDDCVDIMMWLFDTPDVSGLYNLGTGTACSFADLAEAVYTAMGSAPNIEFIDTPEEIRDKYQYFTQANMAKLRAAGCSHEFRSLEDGVAEYVQDFLDQNDPYR
ncbi:MAG: ADP-glyceromanno-heptose 6-epimerase [Alphaproteobacteria bacterium]|nr:ADP-glyceromanno-heptose 6-epimerase [Alphaproteobacteria bacterium]